MGIANMIRRFRLDASTVASRRTSPRRAGPMHMERLEDRVLLCDPGTLDPTFGTGGKVLTDLGGNDGYFDVAVEADGQIVAAGSTNGKVAVARYNSDGSLDSSFGTGGKVTIDFGTGNDGARSVVVQPDGKIVVGVRTGNSSGSAADFAAARLNADGSLDANFNRHREHGQWVGGTIKIDFSTKKNSTTTDLLHDMVLQADGKIVLLGRINYGSSKLAMARLTASGTLDSTFGSNGKVMVQIGSGVVPEQFVIRPEDGRFIVAGNTQGADTDFFLARFNTNGSVDTTFGAGGIVTADVLPGDDALGLTLQTDGSIVLAGSVRPDAAFEARDSVVLRYTSSGSLDTSFGNNGVVVLPIGDVTYQEGSDQLENVVVQSDGKIVASGWAAMGAATGFDQTVIRLDSSGNLDTTFGGTGIVAIDFGTGSEFGRGLALQADGHIIKAGNTSAGSDATLARLCP